MTITRGAFPLALTLSLVLPTAARAGSTEPLRLRTNAAFAPCVSPALEAFTRRSGIPVTVTVAEPDPAGDADVVVGDDAEMTRLLEGGTADVPSSFDLGYLPWVYVAPAGSARGLAAFSGADAVVVMGGAAGREARLALQGLSPSRVRASTDGPTLRAARHALVPRTLAGPGEQRDAGLRPLVATAARIVASPRSPDATRLLDFLRSSTGRQSLGACFQAGPAASVRLAPKAPVHAVDVVDHWLPACSLTRNGYNEAGQVVGPPDAVNLGGRDRYTGILSLGQGGYVTVDMGQAIVDGPGDEVRVYQTTSGEPVTVYAASTPAGPFVLIGFRRTCNVRSTNIFSNHCDFDLREGGLTEVRYLKVEDGELYPCLAGDTLTEGADIDSIENLTVR